MLSAGTEWGLSVFMFICLFVFLVPSVLDLCIPLLPFLLFFRIRLKFLKKEPLTPTLLNLAGFFNIF